MAYGSVQTARKGRKSHVTEVASGSEGSATTAENSQQIGDGTVDGDGDGNGAKSWWLRVKAFYHENIGLFFVFLAQIFASIMAMTTRLLETGFETKFHALQIIFVRMAVTSAIGSVYLWRKKVADFPLGPRGVRWLLVLRGLAGTMGLFGLYYSLSFLDVADATVITFLVPTLTGFVCWVALREPFTVREAIAGLLAFVGVMFIARPSFIFSHLPFKEGNVPEDALHAAGDGIFDPVPATPAERSLAVVCAVIGSFCAATAYATIRVIGKRVHSLVSVNYFAVSATVASFLGLLIIPDIGFKTPQSTAQWLLLASIGISGFLLQVLLTEGLQRERAGRATNMIYTQLVCALIIERVVWGTTPPLESFVGSALIIGAAVWVGLQKKAPAAPAIDQLEDEEERPLLQPED